MLPTSSSFIVVDNRERIKEIQQGESDAGTNFVSINPAKFEDFQRIDRNIGAIIDRTAAALPERRVITTVIFVDAYNNRVCANLEISGAAERKVVPPRVRDARRGASRGRRFRRFQFESRDREIRDIAVRLISELR